jgi:hypothetical protein
LVHRLQSFSGDGIGVSNDLTSGQVSAAVNAAPTSDGPPQLALHSEKIAVIEVDLHRGTGGCARSGQEKNGSEHRNWWRHRRRRGDRAV